MAQDLQETKILLSGRTFQGFRDYFPESSLSFLQIDFLFVGFCLGIHLRCFPQISGDYYYCLYLRAGKQKVDSSYLAHGWGLSALTVGLSAWVTFWIPYVTIFKLFKIFSYWDGQISQGMFF